MATSLTIERQNGNIPKLLDGQDHVSGFIAYIDRVGNNFLEQPIHAISTLDEANKLKIGYGYGGWCNDMVFYQLEEIFRVNPGIRLYVGLFPKTENSTYKEIKLLQNSAGGAIRQIGIWDGETEIATANIEKIQAVAEELDAENAPVSVLYAPGVTESKALDSVLPDNCERVSVVIAQDGSGKAAELFYHEDNPRMRSVTAIGVALGTLSKAAVHEIIAWVKKFPSGVSVPALSDGALIKDFDKAELEMLDAARFLYLRNVVGVADSYWNDSYTMFDPTSDYAYIENVRTMDKAVRGIRTYLTPELGGNVYIDPDTGRLQSYTVSHLVTTANIPLENMEKAGELSGYRAEIDPEQDVLSTGTVEVVIKNVPVGVVRKIGVGDTLNLYGMKALAIRLRDGSESERAYLESLTRSGNKQIEAYAQSIIDKQQRHAESAESDIHEAVRSLACYAPVKDNNVTTTDNKTAAKRFYNFRKMLFEVYPLEWLTTDNGF